jgi:uncharacterized protein (DUF2147 family)
MRAFATWALLALAAGLAPALSATSVRADDGASALLGTWLTEDKSHVTISICPAGYCGVLTHVTLAPAAYAKLSPAEKKAADAQDPRQYLDIQNKDKSLRSRSLIGLQMFSVKPDSKPDTFTGTLYNPADGGTYEGNIRVESNTQLLLSGCLFKVLCRSQEWNRMVVKVPPAPGSPKPAAAVEAAQFQ